MEHFYYDPKNANFYLGYSLPKEYNSFSSLSSFIDRVYPEDDRRRHSKRLMFLKKNGLYDKLTDLFTVESKKQMVYYNLDDKTVVKTADVKLVYPIIDEEFRVSKNKYSCRYFELVRRRIDQLTKEVLDKNNSS